MVPCYNEGDKELRKTIDSVLDATYPDTNKVLLVVADGNITGKGESRSTPETLSKILGYQMNPNDRMYKCQSIGDLTENRAKLHYGIYSDAGKELKYLVVVKCGLPSEKGSPRAGNRGKRDSQLLFTGLLNRFHHGRELNDLDNAMKHALESLQLPLDEVRLCTFNLLQRFVTLCTFNPLHSIGPVSHGHRCRYPYRTRQHFTHGLLNEQE